MMQAPFLTRQSLYLPVDNYPPLPIALQAMLYPSRGLKFLVSPIEREGLSFGIEKLDGLPEHEIAIEREG